MSHRDGSEEERRFNFFTRNREAKLSPEFGRINALANERGGSIVLGYNGRTAREEFRIHGIPLLESFQRRAWTLDNYKTAYNAIRELH